MSNFESRIGKGIRAVSAGTADVAAISAVSSHVEIDRPFAALRRRPGYVLVGVLDIAGLAVDAVLRVDDEARLVAFLHPFVDRRRAVARGRSGEYIVLAGLLDRRVGDAQMHRL